MHVSRDAHSSQFSVGALKDCAAPLWLLCLHCDRKSLPAVHRLGLRMSPNTVCTSSNAGCPHNHQARGNQHQHRGSTQPSLPSRSLTAQGTARQCPVKCSRLCAQAYNARDARDLYDSNMVQGLPVLDWASLAKAPAIDRTLSPLRPYYQCCGLKPGHNMIDFAEDCGWDNFMAPNYTDPALPFAAPVADNATQLRVQNTTEALGAEVAEAQPNAAVSLRRWRKQQAGEARSQT